MRQTLFVLGLHRLEQRVGAADAREDLGLQRDCLVEPVHVDLAPAVGSSGSGKSAHGSPNGSAALPPPLAVRSIATSFAESGRRWAVISRSEAWERKSRLATGFTRRYSLGSRGGWRSAGSRVWPKAGS